MLVRLSRVLTLAALIAAVDVERAEDEPCDPSVPTRVRATLAGPVAHVSARYTAALERGAVTSGGSDWGTICGCDGVGTIAHGSGTGTRAPAFDTEKLREQIGAAIATCHPKDTRVEVALETTLVEIVDVTVTALPANAATHDCIAEAVWNVSLSVPHAPPHATTSLAYAY